LLIGGLYFRKLPPIWKNPDDEEEKFPDVQQVMEPGQRFTGGFKLIVLQFFLSDVFEYINETETWRLISIPDKKMFLPRGGINPNTNLTPTYHQL